MVGKHAQEQLDQDATGKYFRSEYCETGNVRALHFLMKVSYQPEMWQICQSNLGTGEGYRADHLECHHRAHRGQ